MGAEFKMSAELMKEARELIAYYDERGWDWSAALAFTMCREMFGSGFRIYNPETHYAMQKRSAQR